MKVYLAKSNRSNPEHYMQVKTSLALRDIEIIEYKGGIYDESDILSCDSMIVVPEKMIHPVPLGKGLYLQINKFIELNRPVYLTTYISELSLLSGKSVKIDIVKMNKANLVILDSNNWIKYGEYKVDDMRSLNINRVVPEKKEIEIYL